MISGKGAHSATGITQVQTKQYSSTSSSTTHVLTWNSTPTSGNLLVITVATDAAMTSPPSGWTTNVSVADFVGSYIISKISAGTESSVTVTINASDSCALAGFEYSGIATGIDKTASANFQGGSGFIGCGTTATTTAANELLIAFVSSNQTARSVSSWDNSFTQLGSKGQTTGSAANVWNTSAYRVVSSTGAFTTNATLDANSGSHDNGMIATFK